MFLIFSVTFSPSMPFPLVAAEISFPFLNIKFKERPSIFGSHKKFVYYYLVDLKIYSFDKF